MHVFFAALLGILLATFCLLIVVVIAVVMIYVMRKYTETMDVRDATNIKKQEPYHFDPPKGE